jgi:hypothetical protein
LRRRHGAIDIAGAGIGRCRPFLAGRRVDRGDDLAIRRRDPFAADEQLLMTQQIFGHVSCLPKRSSHCHCEERSDEAIQSISHRPWIASLRSQ